MCIKIRKNVKLRKSIKNGPSCSVLPKLWTNFEKCIICQRNCDEEVNICTHNSKSSFLNSEGICIKFIDEYGSSDQIQADDINMVYHRSCCKSYTSKRSIAENVVQRAPIRTVLPLLFKPVHSLVPSIGMFCNNKTYKNVKTLKKIESIERISHILVAANHYSDSNMTNKTSQENYKERAKSKELTDDQLLHSIAKITRNHIAKVEFSTEHDPAPADAYHSHSGRGKSLFWLEYDY